MANAYVENTPVIVLKLTQIEAFILAETMKDVLAVQSPHNNPDWVKTRKLVHSELADALKKL